MDKFVDREAIDLERVRSSRFVKITFGVMALVSLALGLLVTGFAQPLGIPQETARSIAIGFLCTAIADTAIIYIWDQIFKHRG
jgi:hypothetical protein